MALDSKDILFQRRNAGNTGFEEVILKDVNNSYIAFGPTGDPEGLPDIPLSDVIVSGSFGAMAGRLVFADGVSGSLTSSAALVYNTASGVLSVTASYSQVSVTASYAVSATPSFNGTGVISSSLQFTTSDKFNVGEITSSNTNVTGTGSFGSLNVVNGAFTISGSGPNVFGESLTDEHQFTGSVKITGSLSSDGLSLFGKNGNVSGSSAVVLLVDADANNGAAGSAAVRISGNTNKERIEIVSGPSGTSVFQGRSVGGTLANPTPTPTNAVQAWFLGGGFDGSIYTNQAGMYVTATQTFTTSSKPSSISFQTTPSGSTTRVDRMTITDAGDVVVSNALSASAIQVNTLHVQTITSSILFSSGSNKLGSLLTDVQEMTGSVSITGSITTDGPSQFTRLGVGTPAHSAIEVDVVGLLVNTPSIRLRASDTASQLLLQTGGGSNSTRMVMIDGKTGGKRWDINNGGIVSGGLTFNNSTDNIQALHIASNGDVGISTTTPSQKLTVAGNATLTGYVQVDSINSGTQGLLFGSDVNLYRTSSNTLKTDDSFVIGTATGSYLTTGVSPFLRVGSNLFSSAVTAKRDGFAEISMVASGVGRVGTFSNHDLELVVSGSTMATINTSGQLVIGADTNLYRSAADTLKTDDDFQSAGTIQAPYGLITNTLYFGGGADVNLYRPAADTLKTDDDLVVGGNLFVNGYVTASFFVPSGSFISGSALSAISASYATTASFASNARDRLTANRTYYVRTDGSDTNNGLTNSSGGAFRTIQKAVEVVCEDIDLNGFRATIQVGNGTYEGPVVLRSYLGSPGLLSSLVTGAPSGSYAEIIGNLTSPSSVVLASSASHALVAIGAPMGWWVNGLSYTTTGAGVNGVLAADQSTLYIGTSSFGACVSHHITAVRNSTVFVNGNYTITGGAATHYTTQENSEISCNSKTITVTGTPAFSTAFARTILVSVIRAQSSTYSGAATGTRYSSTENSVIQTNGGGANYFPGNVAGSTTTGGQYI
jgi:cytoskeletal protein CcmA (bactofilin family)